MKETHQMVLTSSKLSSFIFYPCLRAHKYLKSENKKKYWTRFQIFTIFQDFNQFMAKFQDFKSIEILNIQD